MITFVDTNVILSLIRADDPDHQRSIERLELLRRTKLQTPQCALTEACHFLKRVDLRSRLWEMLQLLSITPIPLADDVSLRQSIFTWMRRYPKPLPDFTDAYLVIAHSMTPKSQIWTYDSEFTNVWRLPNGRPIKVVR